MSCSAKRTAIDHEEDERSVEVFELIQLAQIYDKAGGDMGFTRISSACNRIAAAASFISGYPLKMMVTALGLKCRMALTTVRPSRHLAYEDHSIARQTARSRSA